MIKLKCGQIVSIEEIIVRRTYRGIWLLDPEYYPKINLGIIQKLKCPRSWGENPIHRIELDKQSLETLLPPLTYFAWVIGEPKNKHFYASQLFLTWFDKDFCDNSVTDTIKNHIEGIDWNKYSTDFNF